MKEQLLSPAEIYSVLSEFQIFLVTSFSVLPISVQSNEEFILDDWYQGNWEILVEQTFANRLKQSCRLEVYGEGADCNGASSRVFDPNATATHFLCVNGRYRFDSFVTLIEGRSVRLPPFDYVLCFESENPKEAEEGVFPFGTVAFSLEVD